MESKGQESFGGTIVASLSSKETKRAVAPVEAAENRCSEDVHPLHRTRIFLSEVGTVSSDLLSFTPTMAEVALSRHEARSPILEKDVSVASEDFRQDADSGDDNTTESLLGIRTVQPERVACPFCFTEKQLQWELAREKERSNELKVAERKTRIILFVSVLLLLVASVSFSLGKMISDMKAEKAMAQYMAQCSDMIEQKESDELYWKLVHAAFSSIFYAMAGRLANFVVGTEKS